MNLTIKKNIIVTGDININILPGENSSHACNYLNLMASHGLIQAVDKPTRYKTCLDHFMVKSNRPFQTIVFNKLTDHSPILLSLDTLPLVRNIPNNFKIVTNVDAVRETLALQNWNNYYAIDNVDDSATYLTNTIQNAIDKNSSVKKIPSKFKALKPWINTGLIKCIRKRNQMQKQCQLSPNDSTLLTKYKKYRNICNNIIKTQKQNYYKKTNRTVKR